MLEENVSVIGGVQRIDEKVVLIKDEGRTCFGKEHGEFSRKTEAHGILEGYSTGSMSQTQEAYHTFDGRFSITDPEDDVDDKHTSEIQDDVFVRQLSNREHYL